MTPDLLTRLAEAKEGSRQLDGDIALAIGAVPAETTRRGSKEAGAEGIFYEPIGGGYWTAPNYTGSFDAAILLVPDECWWLAAKGKTKAREPLFGAQVLRPIGFDEPRVIGEGEHNVSAALALCLAALRARAA